MSFSSATLLFHDFNCYSLFTAFFLVRKFSLYVIFHGMKDFVDRILPWLCSFNLFSILSVLPT